MIDVTAIIVTFNSAAVLPECLNALAGAGVGAIVVDNASADNTAAIAEAAGARTIRSLRNEGFGRGNNRGVAAATSEYVALVNPDLMVTPDCVNTLIAAAKANPAHGVYVPQLVEPDGRAFNHSHSLLGPSASGACMLFRRAVFQNIGGFDENIFLFYEDDDICRRLCDAGLPPLHVPAAIAYHGRGKGSVSTGGSALVRWHQAWSRFYVARKWNVPAPLAPWLLRFGLKYLLACVTFNTARRARYAGSFMGAWSFMRGVTAMQKMRLG